MNSDQLRYLIEISKNPSLSITSQKLHITPQALSTAIKKLEDELGFELLNRSFKGITLTTNGEWLVQEASDFLNKIEDRKEHYLHTQNASYKGVVNIAINHSGINDTVIGELIAQLYDEEPELTISLREVPKEIIFDSVRNQEVDFGFIFRTKVNGTYIDDIDPDFNFDPFFCGNLVLSAAEHTEIAKFNSVTLKKAVQYPLCAYLPQENIKDYLFWLITDIFKLSGQYSTETNFSVYKQKIKRGVANAISVHFPTDNVPNNYIDGAKIIQIRDDIKIYFGLIRRRDIPLSDNSAFFLQELRGLIHNLKYPENE